ncbi:hypothetical protein QL285_075189 [Trifolium repens]|nr:hypothetical protein QL285_075189 [Trifolium repens]
MASDQDFEIPSAGKWTDLMVLVNGEEVIPEPVGSERERKIWTTQLMFPFSLKKENYAFCGPYPPRTEVLSNEVNGLFPKYVTCGPRIFEIEPYNFGYLKNPLKVFRAAPYTAVYPDF